MEVATAGQNILLRAVILKHVPKSNDGFSFVSSCYHLIISVMLVEVHRHVRM